MKKIACILSLTVLLGGAVPMQGADILEQIALYIPNRIIDAFDCFSANLGVGLGARAELAVTQAITVGAGYEENVFTINKDYNRQYGCGFQDGYYVQVVNLYEEDRRRDRLCGLTKSYWETRGGMPLPTDRVNDFQEGARDYWRVGGALGCLILGDVYLHPLEGVDFVLGFFLIDIKADDLVFDDFR